MKKLLFFFSFLLFAAPSYSQDNEAMTEFAEMCNRAEQFVIEDFHKTNGILFSVEDEEVNPPYYYLLGVTLKNGGFITMKVISDDNKYASSGMGRIRRKEHRFLCLLHIENELHYDEIEHITCRFMVNSNDSVAYGDYKVKITGAGLALASKEVEYLTNNSKIADRLKKMFR